MDTEAVVTDTVTSVYGSYVTYDATSLSPIIPDYGIQQHVYVNT